MGDSDIVGPKAIRDGVATDAYFRRTETTPRHASKNPHVAAEVTADQLPGGNFELFTGMKDTAEPLAGRDIDIDAMSEGTLFDRGPAMRIEGDYLGFARLETSLLGFLSHVLDCTTAALEACSAAPDSTVLSSGARHAHPTIAVMVEWSALIVSPDGFLHVAAGEILGKGASGTIPHALPVAFGRGNQAEMFRAFDETVNEDVPRVALYDTHDDETEEMLQAVEALGNDLNSVRLDTISLRRGDFRHIVHKVRWEFDVRGHEDVGISMSGDLGPAELRHLRDVVEGFGAGSHISSANPVDSMLDIAEVNGESVVKRSKPSDVREVYRMTGGDHHIGLRGRPGPINGEPLLEPLIHDGEAASEFDFDIGAAATQASEDAESVGFGEVNEE